MDQALVRSMIAPAKLIWKNQLGRDFVSVYNVDRSEASRTGAVTAIVKLEGDLEGRVLYVLSEEAAKSVEAGFNPRWSEGLTKETIEAVTKLMKPVVANIPKVIETIGLTCTADLTGVLDTKGKGVANPDKWPGVAVLEMDVEIAEGEEQEQIAVWIDVKQSDESALLGQIKSDLDSRQNGPYEGDMSGLTADEAAREKLRSASIAANITELDSSGRPDGDGEHEIKVYPEVKAGIVTVEKLEIVNDEAKTRTVMGTLGDGSPYMALADEHGRIRATFKLDSEGDATLAFTDDAGVQTWVAPADMPTPIHRGPAKPPPPRGRPQRKPPANGAPPRRRPAPRPRPGQRPAPARGRPQPRAPRR